MECSGQTGVIGYTKAYANDGWIPLPLRPQEKVPRMKNWTSTSVTDSGLEHTFHEGDNIGLLLGHRNLVDPMIVTVALKIEQNFLISLTDEN
jgi:hypothetical protein